MKKQALTRLAMAIPFAAGLAIGLAGCGGSGNSGNNAGNPPALAPPATQNPAPAATVATPLPAGQSYIGTISFGDTIRVDFDQPAVGQATLTFVDSQFGLSGSLVASYTASGTVYTFGTLSASATAPAALAAAAANMTLNLSVVKDASNHGILTGALQNVPNLKANDGSLLQGEIEASNNGPTDVAGLAGTYSFVKLSGDYSAGGVPQGDQDAQSGQVKFNADGSFRLCEGQAYSDACVNLDVQTNTSSAATGTVTVEPNQTLYPGAFVLTTEGTTLGRMFVSTSNGQTSLFLDQAGVNSEGTFRTGSWVFTTTQALAANSADGTWTCSEPDVADNSNTLTGKTHTTMNRFSGAQATPLNLDGTVDTTQAVVPLFYNQTFDSNASQSTLTLASSAVNGLIAGEWTGTFQNKQVTGALVFLPISSTQISYLDEVNGNGFFVMGNCTR